MSNSTKDKSTLSTQHAAVNTSESEPSTGDSPLNTADPETETKPVRSLAYWDIPRSFTRWQRIQIALLSRLAAFLIRSIGLTLRWESEGDEHLERVYKEGRQAILTFWHCCTFASAYRFRNQGIVVMSSQNFDSECLAGGLLRLGYGLAKGSTSRGGLKALAEMARSLRNGKDVAFTVDGSSGPRHVAKPGPVLLAKRTGDPVACFHISLQRKILLNTWDQTQIPIPFSKAFIVKAPPIYVPRDVNEDQLTSKIAEMQRTLDELREKAEGHWN